ncbi:MAG: putative 2OG-Fe(II) oxygenase [Pseudomonadota bacterium]
MSDLRFDDQLENHYPLLVMQRQFSGVESLNAELLALVLELEDRYRDSPENAVKSGEISTQGGYQTSTQMNLFTLEHPAIARFRDELVLPTAGRYLEAVFDPAGAERLDPWPVGWANVLDEGDWQGPHFHPTRDNIASGVYYVELPEDRPNPEGRIEFLNPIPESVYHGYSASRRLHPAPGKMVLFPPYYVHYVHPFRGGARRAVIAFDILSKRPGLNLVF